jgi:hypothetical protein
VFDAFKKRIGAAQPIATASQAARYDGKPLLVILDNFVLSAIGHTSPETEHRLIQVVNRVWPGAGDWKTRVCEQLQLAPNIEDELQALWRRNLQIAADAGAELSPQEFAVMVVDTNFALYLSNG